MDINNMTILICDDSILIRKKLKESINKAGCTSILEAANGDEAINLYKTKKPELVFMDIIMPGIDGVAAVQEILNIDPDAKVVVLSSIGTQSNIRGSIDAGAFDFLQKPFEDKDILHIIEHVAKGGK